MKTIKQYLSTYSIIFILLSLYLSGCTSLGGQTDFSDSAMGQLSIFLEGPDKDDPDITFNLLSVNIIAEDGTSIQVEPGTQTINSRSISGAQINLGEISLPVGKYIKLDFIIKNATVKKNNEIKELTVVEDISVPINMKVKRQQNSSVFIYLNTEGSVSDDHVFKPMFAEKGRAKELSSSLIYVTNESSDNVSVINRYSGEVIETIMTGKSPRGITASLAGDRPKIYVANSGANSVSVIDPTTNKVENEIPVRFGTEPVDLTVGTIQSGRKLLFIANYKSNSVSIMDLSTYRELEKVDVGSGPIALEADPSANNLIVSRFLSFEKINELKSYREKFLNVYVVNQNSNNISILRINVITGRCEDVLTLGVDWDPRSLHIDYSRGNVYVVNYGSDKLSVINILKTLTSGGAGSVTSINNVGNLMTDVITDPGFDRIYLLRASPGELIIIKPFSATNASVQTALQPIMSRIGVGNKPRAFMFDSEKRKIFVVNHGSDNVYVIDKTTRRTERIISVGKGPYDIAMLPE
jgi:YVTN family beta-propeller protein